MKRWLVGGLACMAAATFAAREYPVYENADSSQGLSPYKPMYAVIGNDPILEAKLQFSFKYRFFDERTHVGKWTAPFDQLYFGYTQKMFWDLEENSAPYPNNYLDNYFSPELFYLKRNLCRSIWSSQFDLQFGYQHESNGRDGIDARNWERLYIQPGWCFGDAAGWQFVTSLRIWAIAGRSEQNADIADYLGYGELQLKLGRDDGLALETVLRKGMTDWNGSVELNVSYPIHPISLYLYGQAFYGDGDALRIYDEEVSNFRLGVALFR